MASEVFITRRGKSIDSLNNVIAVSRFFGLSKYGFNYADNLEAPVVSSGSSFLNGSVFTVPGDLIDNKIQVKVAGGGGGAAGFINSSIFGLAGGGGGYYNSTIFDNLVTNQRIAISGLWAYGHKTYIVTNNSSNIAVGTSGTTVSFGTYLSANGGTGGNASNSSAYGGNGGTGGGAIFWNMNNAYGGRGYQFGGGGGGKGGDGGTYGGGGAGLYKGGNGGIYGGGGGGTVTGGRGGCSNPANGALATTRYGGNAGQNGKTALINNTSLNVPSLFEVIKYNTSNGHTHTLPSKYEIDLVIISNANGRYRGTCQNPGNIHYGGGGYEGNGGSIASINFNNSYLTQSTQTSGGGGYYSTTHHIGESKCSIGGGGGYGNGYQYVSNASDFYNWLNADTDLSKKTLIADGGKGLEVGTGLYGVAVGYGAGREQSEFVSQIESTFSLLTPYSPMSFFNSGGYDVDNGVTSSGINVDKCELTDKTCNERYVAMGGGKIGLTTYETKTGNELYGNTPSIDRPTGQGGSIGLVFVNTSSSIKSLLTSNYIISGTSGFSGGVLVEYYQKIK